MPDKDTTERIVSVRVALTLTHWPENNQL